MLFARATTVVRSGEPVDESIDVEPIKMDIRVDVTLPCRAEALLPFVTDLVAYPSWMGLVHAVTPLADGEEWLVELRGKIGPLARSKRLRMILHEDSTVHRVRFVRRESDGRSHSSWILEALVDEVGNETNLKMTLHYGGRLFSGVVERALQDEIEASKRRLRDLVLAAQ